MVSQKLYDLCASNLSIAAELKKSPRQAPGEIIQRLLAQYQVRSIIASPPKERKRASLEDLDRAKKCGRFGTTQPCELFLRAFHDVLGTLEQDPMASSVLPSLVGTTGTAPCAIVGPLVDIVRHMSNLIVRAKKEVLLATNYWVCSGASQLITDALLELSRRAAARGDLVAFRIMYDRGNARQLLDNHQIVSEEERTSPSVKLPPARDIPNVDLQVVNFHQYLAGTFHSKFMIVDREIGIVQSKNIQDNDNVEFMTQVEGPVVDSLWEAFLASWHTSIGPLPCVEDCDSSNALPTPRHESSRQLLDADGLMLPAKRLKHENLAPHVSGSPYYDNNLAGEIYRTAAMLSPLHSTETRLEIVARHLNQSLRLGARPSERLRSSDASEFFPVVPIPPHKPVPMAIVGRTPFGSPIHTSLYVPQNEAFLSLCQNATRTIFIQTPNLNAAPLYDALLAAVRRGIQVTYYVCLGYNDAGELLPGQNGTNEMFANSLMKALEESSGPGGLSMARDNLRVHYYVAKDQIEPIHNRFKQRSCHIKLMIVDESVAVQGSGNQDTQSWWQSQELNIMIDSPFLCRRWREALERNQNTGAFPPNADQMGSTFEAARGTGPPVTGHQQVTKAYGRADDDGCWRDPHGRMANGSLGTDPGRFAWARGIVGAYKRAKGQGGF